jgi:hypothetical protein
MLRILIASYSIVIGRDAYKGTPASKPKNKEKINDSPFFVRQSHIIRATGALHGIICSRLSWQGGFCQGFTGTVAHRYYLCTLHENRDGIGTMGMTTRCRTGYVNSRGREGGLEREVLESDRYIGVISIYWRLTICRMTRYRSVKSKERKRKESKIQFLYTH